MGSWFLAVLLLFSGKFTTDNSWASAGNDSTASLPDAVGYCITKIWNSRGIDATGQFRASAAYDCRDAGGRAMQEQLPRDVPPFSTIANH